MYCDFSKRFLQLQFTNGEELFTLQSEWENHGVFCRACHLGINNISVTDFLRNHKGLLGNDWVFVCSFLLIGKVGLFSEILSLHAFSTLFLLQAEKPSASCP